MLTHNPAFVQNQSKIRLLASSLKSSLKLVKTSACIDKLLLTGVEGVALGANFDLQFTLHGTRLKRLTAYATDDGHAIFRMDLFFHAFSPLLRMLWVHLKPHERL